MMELAKGGELFDRLLEAGSLGEREAGRVMGQVSSLLNLIHGWTWVKHIGRAVRFVDFIAIFSPDIVYFSYRSSHFSLPIFVTAKSCL